MSVHRHERIIPDETDTRCVDTRKLTLDRESRLREYRTSVLHRAYESDVVREVREYYETEIKSQECVVS